ncbi:ATP:cob(I)alamin adenosyltransferase [Rugosibacter aromaticivorans]|uniref:ATP:cob(I)alamin adenosyltransferase n=1 Tax=Rugosibacter aromaticivorans TaxID=1565605 RepID=A0A0C5J8C6_9PROT|nr:heme-binding protein [Rugosibacter aromaticivorans]AJP47909.1 ATP:cob(I)alamin adenosyltransferase [Rugosibacter aromaticivorans]TBR15048.1 MAG: heme-binding protein [Rugosibacter sp.]
MSKPCFVNQPIIDWAAANDAVKAAIEKAVAMGLRVNAAVVDRGGLLVAFLRMPGAPLHSIDIAIDKAYTAAGFGMPTGMWHEALKAHSAAVQQGVPLRPRFTAFGGGLPIIVEGQVIGGIGVSGALEDEDTACAQAGLKVLGLAD